MASFTGHISSFTKDVLRKGAENVEVPDSTTEEVEDSQSVLKSEAERLRIFVVM